MCTNSLSLPFYLDLCVNKSLIVFHDQSGKNVLSKMAVGVETQLVVWLRVFINQVVELVVECVGIRSSDGSDIHGVVVLR